MIRNLKVFSLFYVLFSVNITIQAQQLSKIKSKRIVADTNIILPPSWAFGILYGGYTNQEETISRIETIKKKNYPIDAYWIDSWFWSYNEKGKGPNKYIDFIADTVGYPNRTKMWSYMQQQNIKGGFWIWDCILETGNETAFNDFKSKGYFSSIYTNKNAWHNAGTSTAMFQEKSEHPGTACGNIDFTNPQAVAYFKQQMKPFFEEGADFIKLDRTSAINTCKAMFELSQEFGKETRGRGFLLSHTGGVESEEYKKYPTKWTDDTRSDWTIEQPLVQFNAWVPPVAFKENIAMYTDTGRKTSKIPFLTNDLGGFDMGKQKMPDEELYIRWLQFSMFNPITEVFAQPENPTSNMAWLYSEKADSIFRYYAQWRMQLFPYIYSYALRSRIDGKHMMGKMPGFLYQYMFGNEMLLAPVYQKNVTEQPVFLPEGNWINYWTGEQLSGGKEYMLPVSINQIPLFIKRGSIIPLRHYASSIESGSNDTITLHIYPGSDGSFTLLEDDGTSNDYLQGIYASTRIEMKSDANRCSIKINPVEGTFDGMKQNRIWEFVVHQKTSPKQINSNKKNIPFIYNQSTGETSISLPAAKKSKRLTVDVKFTQ